MRTGAARDDAIMSCFGLPLESRTPPVGRIAPISGGEVGALLVHRARTLQLNQPTWRPASSAIPSNTSVAACFAARLRSVIWRSSAAITSTSSAAHSLTYGPSKLPSSPQNHSSFSNATFSSRVLSPVTVAIRANSVFHDSGGADSRGGTTCLALRRKVSTIAA